MLQRVRPPPYPVSPSVCRDLKSDCGNDACTRYYRLRLSCSHCVVSGLCVRSGLETVGTACAGCPSISLAEPKRLARYSRYATAMGLGPMWGGIGHTLTGPLCLGCGILLIPSTDFKNVIFRSSLRILSSSASFQGDADCASCMVLQRRAAHSVRGGYFGISPPTRTGGAANPLVQDYNWHSKAQLCSRNSLQVNWVSWAVSVA